MYKEIKEKLAANGYTFAGKKHSCECGKTTRTFLNTDKGRMIQVTTTRFAEGDQPKGSDCNNDSTADNDE